MRSTDPRRSSAPLGLRVLVLGGLLLQLLVAPPARAQAQAAEPPHPPPVATAPGNTPAPAPAMAPMEGSAETRAEEPPPPPAAASSEEELQLHAQWHIQQARRHFGAGRYAESVVELQSAYALTPKPILLFNIGQSYRRIGKKRDALEFYQRFIAAEPENKHAAEARTIAAELTSLLKQQEVLEMKERELRRPVWRKPWFWGVLGAGVAAVGLGVGLGYGLRPKDPATDAPIASVRFPEP